MRQVVIDIVTLKSLVYPDISSIIGARIKTGGGGGQLPDETVSIRNFQSKPTSVN